MNYEKSKHLSNYQDLVNGAMADQARNLNRGSLPTPFIRKRNQKYFKQYDEKMRELFNNIYATKFGHEFELLVAAKKQSYYMELGAVEPTNGIKQATEGGHARTRSMA